MNQPPDILKPSEIESRLMELGLLEHDLIYQPETSSTNIDVLDHFHNKGRLSIAICESQTAGRGRRGRQWLSPAAKNIYCTIGCMTSISAASLGLLSIVSGIALCKAIHGSGVDGVRLKWPNDLVFDDGHQKHKLGGILIESRPHAENFFIAIGFGLNVHMDRTELEAIGQPATSLDLLANRPVYRQQLLLSAIASIVDSVERFDETAIDELIDCFSRYDAYHNQPVCVLNGEEKVYGSCCGIDRQGHLLLDTGHGELSFVAAEISLRAG